MSRFLYDIDLDAPVQNGQRFGAWLGDTRLNAELPPEARISAPPPRTLACRIMDWADDVAYAIHDFEDAVLARFITKGAIRRVRDPLLDAVRRDVGPLYEGDTAALEEAFSGYEREVESLLDRVQEAEIPNWRCDQNGARGSATSSTSSISRCRKALTRLRWDTGWRSPASPACL